MAQTPRTMAFGVWPFLLGVFDDQQRIKPVVRETGRLRNLPGEYRGGGGMPDRPITRTYNQGE